MDLNNRFSIVSYVGSEPLNLMAKDASVSADPIRNDQWERMMQAVDTIYATQNILGDQADSIPVFWTDRTSVIDQFGNSSFEYVPSPDSTLKQLSSKSAYYFILRDTSLTPVKIPHNGLLVQDYLWQLPDTLESLPLVSPALPDFTLNESSFKYTFKPQIINLRPNVQYTYSWETVDANWPVSINSRTGVLKPASPTGTINTSLAFCPTTGTCSASILPYTIPPECSLEKLDNPYITLKLSIKTLSGSESLSDQFTLTCDDCLPKPRIDIENITPLDVVEDPSDNAPNPSFNFKLNFANLEIDQEYSYSINTVYSEWPIVFSTPTTGSFLARSSSALPIYGRLFFCPTTGLCLPNGSNIPEYTIPNHPKFLTDDLIYNIILQASLNQTSQCNYSSTFTSNLTTITYKKS
jgi:hypothetical protein